jgi:hypothetical protein
MEHVNKSREQNADILVFFILAVNVLPLGLMFSCGEGPAADAIDAPQP